MLKKSVMGVSLSALIAAGPVWAKDPGISGKEVKLGATTPMTGPVAFYGEMVKGAKAYFDKINAEGGVEGRKITWIVEDDGYNPAKTVPATRKLVERDHVFALFLPLGFPHTAVADYVQKKGLPDMFLSDGSRIWEKYPNAVRGIVPWETDGRILGEYVAKNHAGKTVGFLYENSNLGKEALEGAKAALAGKVKFGPEQSYDPGSPNADAQTTNLLNAKVDVVMALAVTNVTASSMKLAKQKGSNAKFVVSFVNCTPELVGLSGQAAEGVVSTTPLHLSNEDVPAMREHQKILDKYSPGTKASSLSIFGQANAEYMVETLKRAGKKPTRASLLKAAEGLSGFQCSLCLAPTELSKSMRDAFSTEQLMQVKNGKWEYL